MDYVNTSYSENVTNLMNITRCVNFIQRDNSSESDFYSRHIPLIMTVTRTLPPICWFVGIIGNFLSLLVWLQPKMRHSSGYYLAALSVSELIFLPLNIVFEVHFTYNKRLLDHPVLCQWFAISYYTVQQLSPVFVLAFTVERYLSVCHPFRMVNLHKKQNKTALLAIAAISSLFIALNASHGYFWTTVHEYGQICELRKDVTGFWPYWSWTTEMIIFAAVPVTILILNVMVIKEMTEISKLERRNMRTNSIDRRSSTIMLLSVSFYEIFTVLPVAIAYALYSKYPKGNDCLNDEEIAKDPTWQAHMNYVSFKFVIQSIGLTNYAANFFIYLITGKMFRKQLWEMMNALGCKKIADINTKTYTKTTPLSFTQRSSIGKGRLSMGSILHRPQDGCNNEEQTMNKNSAISMAELETLEPSSHPSFDTTVLSPKQITPNSHLLTCVEECEDLEYRESVDNDLDLERSRK